MAVYKILTVVLISLPAAAFSASVDPNAPPAVFWQWNSRYFGRGRSEEEAPQEEIFQSYFDRSNLEKSSTIMGSYNRENPERWAGHPGSRSSVDGSSILVLGKRLKLSRGPRKKRSQLEISSYNDDLEDIQNFRRENFPSSDSNEISVSEIVYLDPLFKIPVVQRVAASPPSPKTRPTPTPTTPTSKSSVKSSQRRCDALNGDCFDEFQKVFSVGPYVQTRLVIFKCKCYYTFKGYLHGHFHTKSHRSVVRFQLRLKPG